MKARDVLDAGLLAEAWVALRPRPFRSVANDHKSGCNADPVLYRHLRIECGHCAPGRE